MRTACSLSAPLSQKQKTVWSLLNEGFPVSIIADKLNTTRQFVNQTKLAAEAKLSATLLDVAQANGLQVTRLSLKVGLLLGYHPVLKRKAIITYSSHYGIKVWYWYDNPEDVTDELFLKQARTYLLDIAKERGIEITEAAEFHPAKLAQIIFGKLLPEVES